MSFLSATAQKAMHCGKSSLSRRSFIIGTAAVALAGCQTTGTPQRKVVSDLRQDPYYQALYGPLPNEDYPVPAVNLNEISDGRYLRQVVSYTGPEAGGTIVVDPANRFLYLVRGDGTAVRYGVGVGRSGFGWNGSAVIQYKRQWPTWTPPAEMIARQPELESFRRGMAPGIENPLGARALYLFQNGNDTLYRLHGTNEHWSIGKNVSSGCIRLLNQDVIDLYNRVPNGSPVVVRPAGNPVEAHNV
ncbi:putative L,D-transpeptidase YbiS precursor [Pseudovibrio axinellae]|uniref:Putative L,D-transpeptidase YbiS n=1 Tax=Pseudovibrio axinellae TaxID=989403 RepID=A0A165XL57_9HYPH|nr:L,D-transpeptidase [Pseudovibrio axinellae]KZL17810.1 putative L,D-transpeptidase YbiS precursor [Pseudovibrio axinellae]SEP71575.1 Lipoprotein-anchoring transpeptidase ErfK/SrfK [Pseudovibrio axinellae]